MFHSVFFYTIEIALPFKEIFGYEFEFIILPQYLSLFLM